MRKSSDYTENSHPTLMVHYWSYIIKVIMLGNKRNLYSRMSCLPSFVPLTQVVCACGGLM